MIDATGIVYIVAREEASHEPQVRGTSVRLSAGLLSARVPAGERKRMDCGSQGAEHF